MQPRSIGTNDIWSNAGNKAVTMPLNSGASRVSNAVPANPASYATGSENIAVREDAGPDNNPPPPRPAVIPATSRMAIAETVGRRSVIPARTVPAVSGDRHMCLAGARILPHHPATGRRRIARLARCRSRKLAGKLRQASLSRRKSRTCGTSTALEQRSSRRACSPIEVDQTLHVRPSQLRLATLACRECRLNPKPIQERRRPAHSSSNVRKNHFYSATSRR